MAKKTSFLLRPFKKVPIMMGYDHLLSGANFIRSMTYRLLKTDSGGQSFESFEDAVIYFGLTEDQLAKKKRYFHFVAWMYLVVSLVLLAYAVYAANVHRYDIVIPVLALMFMVLSFSYREHYWYMQIRHRRLQIGPKMWLRLLLKGEAK
jgi:hypothetical protein